MDTRQDIDIPLVCNNFSQGANPLCNNNEHKNTNHKSENTLCIQDIEIILELLLHIYGAIHFNKNT
jgi:hypothetical protein